MISGTGNGILARIMTFQPESNQANLRLDSFWLPFSVESMSSFLFEFRRVSFGPLKSRHPITESDDSLRGVHEMALHAARG